MYVQPSDKTTAQTACERRQTHARQLEMRSVEAPTGSGSNLKQDDSDDRPQPEAPSALRVV